MPIRISRTPSRPPALAWLGTILFLVLCQPCRGDEFRPGGRVLLDAHNCYPYQGRWADRLERALATGVPVAIEQDLVWYTDSDSGRSRSIVSHGSPFTGQEPSLREYFFHAISPLVEAAFRSDDRSQWPLITLNLDFKDNHPRHLRAIRSVLDEYADWICSAERVGEQANRQPLDVRPVLVLIGGSAEQEQVFHDEIPIGGRVRAFGRAITEPQLPGQASDGDPPSRVDPARLLVRRADNWRRWWNNSWHAIENGGAPGSGDWTGDEEARLRAFVRRAHELGYWIRFYTINGHPADHNQGWSSGYNTGSLDAARIRWQAQIDAGVDFVATDMYEAFASMLPRTQKLHPESRP
jgi:hypothetical protein